MKGYRFWVGVIALVLVGCSNATAAVTQTSAPSTPVPRTPALRFTMLPTWTPVDTPIPVATRTPRKTATPRITSTPLPYIGGNFSTELLVDRPSYTQAAETIDLSTMLYKPSVWSLSTSYTTNFIGYSLTHRSIYGCKLEPSLGADILGLEVEVYKRTLGSTKYDISRFSQAGGLLFASYCTGEGANYTCYTVTPGDEHTACIEATEEVLSSYKLISNPFYNSTVKPLNRWVCQDAAGTIGLCTISYSIPLNALAFTPDGQGWAAGDDGILLHKEGQTWKEVSSPATHPLYDLHFSSASNGWAVGDGAEVLHWDGSHWAEVLPYHGPGEGPGGSTQVLYAVDTDTINDAWMVGVMKGIDGKNRPYALHWNGKDLIEENDFPDCNCGLNAVLIRAKDDLYAAGGSDLGAMIFHWDGSSWTSTYLAGADHLYSLSQAMDGSLWAVGIEVARDQTVARGALFHRDGSQWQRVALPPLTGGIYALSVLSTGQIVVGGDFTALRSGLDWQAISTDIAAYQWIVDVEQDPQGAVWALTRSGNLFQLGINR